MNVRGRGERRGREGGSTGEEEGLSEEEKKQRGSF